MTSPPPTYKNALKRVVSISPRHLERFLLVQRRPSSYFHPAGITPLPSPHTPRTGRPALIPTPGGSCLSSGPRVPRPRRPFRPRGGKTAGKAGLRLLSMSGKGLRLHTPKNGSETVPHSPDGSRFRATLTQRAAHNGDRRPATKCVSASAWTTTPSHPCDVPARPLLGGGHLGRPSRMAGEAAQKRAFAGDPRWSTWIGASTLFEVAAQARTELCSATRATICGINRKLGREGAQRGWAGS